MAVPACQPFICTPRPRHLGWLRFVRAAHAGLPRLPGEQLLLACTAAACLPLEHEVRHGFMACRPGQHVLNMQCIVCNMAVRRHWTKPPSCMCTPHEALRLSAPQCIHATCRACSGWRAGSSCFSSRSAAAVLRGAHHCCTAATATGCCHRCASAAGQQQATVAATTSVAVLVAMSSLPPLLPPRGAASVPFFDRTSCMLTGSGCCALRCHPVQHTTDAFNLQRREFLTNDNT